MQGSQELHRWEQLAARSVEPAAWSPKFPVEFPVPSLCPSYRLSQIALFTLSVPSWVQGGQPVLLSLQNKKEQRFGEAK